MFKLEKFYEKGFDPQEYWDDKYSKEHIAGKSSEEYAKQAFWPLLEKNLDKESGHYLDAGCGIGGWILFLKEQGYNVEGIEIAQRTVKALTSYDRELRIKIASITRIPHADSSFDGVLSIGVLEYVENEVPQALAEVNRVLKPGGFMFIEVPIANTLRKLAYIPLKKIQKLVMKQKGSHATFSNYLFDRWELIKLIEQAGFEIAEVRPHELPEEDSHYGMWIDFKFLRGKEAYKLNALGKIVKKVCNAISPWIASTGMVVVARKKNA